MNSSRPILLAQNREINRDFCAVNGRSNRHIAKESATLPPIAKEIATLTHIAKESAGLPHIAKEIATLPF